MLSEPALVTHPIESPCSPPKTTVSFSPTSETSQTPSTGQSHEPHQSSLQSTEITSSFWRLCIVIVLCNGSIEMKCGGML
jgi:hypothetical protein